MAWRTQKSMWRDGDNRRSPRIWAISSQNAGQLAMFDSRKDTRGMQENIRDEQGPPSQTRARLKRKLQAVTDNSVSTNSKQKRESPHLEDHSTSIDPPLIPKAKEGRKNQGNSNSPGQASVASFMPSMPEKRILELILDVLQRRDTYEIFAQPVDPNEVEDYYEIVKEPMDFGTMRAKLHEGMYRSLEQFEHDVFLIPRNAMHFNSNGSMYFRLARAIQELAKKVFHVLRTDPENFELEFSGTRRRSARRPLVQAKNSKFSTPAINISPKHRPSASSGMSIFRKSSRAKHGFYSAAADTTDCDFFSGPREGRKSSFAEADRRWTYRPWRSFHNENNPLLSSICRDLKSPEFVDINYTTIDYTKSLMSFVKDLGSTAQMVARRKLLGCQEDASVCQMPSSDSQFRNSKYQTPAAFVPDIRLFDHPDCRLHQMDNIVTPASQKFNDPLLMSPSVYKPVNDVIDLTESEDGEAPSAEDRVGHHGALSREKTPNIEKSIKGGEIAVPVLFSEGRVTQNQSARIQLDLNASSAGDLNCSTTKKDDAGAESTSLTVSMDNFPPNMQSLSMKPEHYKSSETELKLRNKNRSTSFPWLSQSSQATSWNQSNYGLDSHSQATAATPGLKNECYSLCQPSQSVELNKANKPLVSQFTFDLPFLQSKLNEMNDRGQNVCMQAGLQRDLDWERPSSSKRAFNCTNQAETSTKVFARNQLQSPWDTLDTDLALQL